MSVKRLLAKSSTSQATTQLTPHKESEPPKFDVGMQGYLPDPEALTGFEELQRVVGFPAYWEDAVS